MTIGVHTTTDYTVNYEDATGWHVDETGALHITKTGKGNIATFHPGAWAFVNRSPEDQSSPTGVTIKVACPVCGKRLEYHHAENEAWWCSGWRTSASLNLPPTTREASSCPT